MLEIVPATAADAEAIIALQRLAYESEAQLYNDWSLPPLTQTAASLRTELAHSLILKAIRHGTIIGSVRASLSNTTCKIGRLIVHPDFQRQGVGARLLQHIEQLHPEAATFELFTGSKSLNNIRFYEAQGYQKTRTQMLSDTLALSFLAKPNSERA